MSNYLTLTNLVLSGLVATCLLLVVYLLGLQIKDYRRNLRMEAKREQLGLKRGTSARPFRPKYPLAPTVTTRSSSPPAGSIQIGTVNVKKLGSSQGQASTICPRRVGALRTGSQGLGRPPVSIRTATA